MGANPAFVPTASSPSVSTLSGFNPGERVREALIAYWKIDACPQRAELLRAGLPMDYVDERIIAAINAYNAVFEDRKIAA